MRFWRLSKAAYADRLDGGYGLRNTGRWNLRGRLVTYCSTSPPLCLLETLVHVEDVTLLPPYKLVEYNAPDDISISIIDPAMLAEDWQSDETISQAIGEEWITNATSALLRVPSAVLPSVIPERNLVINHAHPDASSITIAAIHDFWFDQRL